MEKNILDWAKRFASAGYYVFPLYDSSNGPQKPFGWARNTNPKYTKGDKAGQQVEAEKIIPATKNPLDIDEWPVRIKAGYKSKVVAYGVMGLDCILVDLDVKTGKEGYKEFKELQTQYKIPQPSIVVKTKSGGFHLYYKKPDRYSTAEVKTFSGFSIAGRKYAGVDVRGDGGMVIGPLSEGSQDDWTNGEYKLIRGKPGDELTEFPEEIFKACIKNATITNGNDDLENLAALHSEKDANEDVLTTLRRGEIPKMLPNGQRNEGFYAFVNGLKNRGIPLETARFLCEKLADVTEEKETLHESVNVEEMLSRVYSVNTENPFDMARDLINHGMYQLMSYQKRIHYVIYNDNPYLVSRSAHDETSMRTLLARYVRYVEQPGGKKKEVHPMDIIIRAIPDTNKVDSIGFKPGAPDIFTNSEDHGARRFLNTYNAPYIPKSPGGLDDTIYDELRFVIGRIFGEAGTDEFQLGMDFSAWFFQKPGNKPGIAPYLMSRNRGVGKSLYISIMSMLMGVSKSGERQATLAKIDDVSRQFFNPADYALIMFDEVQFPVHKDMRKESTTFWRYLKNLVTAEMIPVEIKNGPTYQLPNLAGLILAGNSGAHFPIEEYDRRIWVIDNNPPEMARGLVDRLYSLQKGEILNPEEKRKLIYTLRYWLSKHPIKMDLDIMRAPMTEAKREMYMDSLSDIEEWWITHFEDHENLLASTPILTKSAIIYLIETSERLMNTRYREDPESTFRDLKRRKLIVPIKTKGNQGQSRNMYNVPLVSANGDMVDNDKREVLYTSRDHGKFDDQDNPTILQLYVNNISRIKNWKSAKIKSITSTATASNLLQ